MLSINPKYLVDQKGRKTAAVLSMKDYRLLMQRLEDLEDALDLDEASDRFWLASNEFFIGLMMISVVLRFIESNIVGKLIVNDKLLCPTLRS